MGGEFYGPLGTLNGATTYVTTLSGGATQTATLVVGGVYRIQGSAGGGSIGFGSTTAAAQTDANTVGEIMGSGTPPQVYVIVNDTVKCVACSDDSGDFIIRKCAVS